MAQATLSPANVVQAKTGHTTTDPASVALDSPCQAGSTITVEISLAGLPLMDGGMAGRIPDGFEYDACSIALTSRYQHVFRKRNVAAGEGVAGSTPWDFSIGVATTWLWRVTEWDTNLEPVFPLDAVSYGSASGAGVTSLSTGTVTSQRPNAVALAWHQWTRGSNVSQGPLWSGHTNGFVERDELRITQGTGERDSSWSWKFLDTAGAIETTATVDRTSDAQDVFSALLVVYAATTYA